MCSVIFDRLRSVAAARNVMPTPSAAARTLRFVSTMSFVPSPMLIAARPPAFSAACTRPSHASWSPCHLSSNSRGAFFNDCYEPISPPESQSRDQSRPLGTATESKASSLCPTDTSAVKWRALLAELR